MVICHYVGVLNSMRKITFISGVRGGSSNMVDVTSYRFR